MQGQLRKVRMAATALAQHQQGRVGLLLLLHPSCCDSYAILAHRRATSPALLAWYGRGRGGGGDTWPCKAHGAE
jgi:hypothetical protein